jgi:hypothetical protein
MADKGADVKVDLTNALKVLGIVARAAADLSPIMGGVINRSVDTYFKRRFDSEGAYGGTRWKGHAPATKRARQMRGRGRGGILRDRNRLWASLTKSGLGPDAIKRVTDHSLERGTKVPYARPINNGYRSKTFITFDSTGAIVPLRRKHPKRIAARPIIPASGPPNELVQAWERYLAKHITK